MTDIEIAKSLSDVLETVSQPFWVRGDFWIGAVLNVLGLVFSVLAYSEAKKARAAALSAGRNVKSQTVAIELSEVTQRIQSLAENITFREARDILSESSRRIRRAVSPFESDGAYKQAIASLKEAIQDCQTALQSVRPSTPSSEHVAPNSVYFAVEQQFAAINDSIADLVGLLEKSTIENGGR